MLLTTPAIPAERRARLQVQAVAPTRSFDIVPSSLRASQRAVLKAALPLTIFDSNTVTLLFQVSAPPEACGGY